MASKPIYVDDLGFFAAVRIAANPLFKDCSRVYCLDMRPLAAAFLRLLKCRCPGFAVTRLHNDIADIVDGSGRSVRYQLEEMLQELCLGLQTDMERLPFFRRGVFRGMPPAWVERYFIHCLYQIMRPTARAMVILATARERHGDEGTVFLRANTLFAALRSVGMPQPKRLAVYGRLGRRIAQPVLVLAVSLGIIGLACWHAAHSALLRARKAAPRPPFPMALVQYCWGHDPRQKNDINFLQDGHLAPERVLFYFTRPDTPLTPAIAREIEQLGLGGILRPRKLTNTDGLKRLCRRFSPAGNRAADAFEKYNWYAPASVAVDIVSGTVRLLSSLIPSLRNPLIDGWNQFAIMHHALSFYLIFSYWRSFFSFTNAFSHLSYSGDCGGIHTLQTLAMDAVGGINIRSNYSYTSLPDINFSREFHLYFSWGAQPRCSANIEHFYCQAQFQVGYIYDYIINRATSTPATSTSAKTFTIVLFDEAIGKSVCHSHNVVEEFYQLFFDLLKEHAQWRLYIKSKTLDREGLAALFPGFAPADATGRVTVFPPEVLPCQAAAEADIAACSGLNTAGIEAALAGRPAVFLMHDKARCPQLERPQGGKAVYRSVDALKDDLRRILEGKEWPQGFGDLGPALDAIDPFRDGRSGARMGFVLARYLDEKQRGTPHREAVRRCAETFASACGQHVVLDDSPGLYRPLRKGPQGRS